MKQNCVFLIIVACLCFSCTNKSNLYFDNNSNYFDVEYFQDSIAITETYKGEKYKTTVCLQNGEYVDMQDNRVLLSTKQPHKILVDDNYVGRNWQFWIEMYKLKDYHLNPDLKELHKEIFVTTFYIQSYDRKEVVRAYYYDKNYKILKITLDNEHAEYNVNHSCLQKGKLAFDNKNNHYEVTYHKDDMVVSEIKHGLLAHNDTLCCKNGEYIDCKKHQVVFSIRSNYDELLDSFYIDKMKNYYWKSIHKLYDYHWTPDLKELHKDVFVTEYYLASIGTKDDKRVVKAFYYDADYKLLKIVVKTRKEFYAK